MFAVIKMELSGKTVYGPVLKTTQLSAHAQNHASPERCRKSFTMIFLGDHDNRCIPVLLLLHAGAAVRFQRAHSIRSAGDDQRDNLGPETEGWTVSSINCNPSSLI